MPFSSHHPALVLEPDNLPPLAILHLMYTLEEKGGQHTGILIHRERPPWMFKKEWIHRSFRTSLAGKPAFTTLSHGYLSSKYFKWPICAHRVVYKMVHGGLCPKIIDHENQILTDNRPSNLRPSSHQHNARNMKRNRTNTSGYTGVVWNKAYKMWTAVIKVDNKPIFLGNYIKIEDAVNARMAANEKYGFSELHGLSTT